MILSDPGLPCTLCCDACWDELDRHADADPLPDAAVIAGKDAGWKAEIGLSGHLCPACLGRVG